MKSTLSVLLVDDHPIFLKGLIDVLMEELDGADLHAFTSPLKALQSIECNSYQVAILDLDMPEMNGIELHSALKNYCPSIKTILLTMHKESDIIRSVMARGFNGYVFKDDAIDELVTAIERVLSGENYCSSYSMIKDDPDPVGLFHAMTKTERLILRGISENKTSRQLASELFVSVKTIDNHRNNISRKLGLQGSNSLLKFALLNKRFL